MAQNIYDRPDFFESYRRLHRSVEGLAGMPEWPALRAMLPDIRGAEVVDLGCGFGWFCRWAREHGAARVVGLDVSENMLAEARRATSDPAISYRLADLDELALPAASVDLAFSALAFHYIENAARLYGQISAALVPGGRLVFSTEHPVFMAPSAPGWFVDERGGRTWPVNRYFAEGVRTTNWLADGVVKYHRTIGTTLNLLIAAGFTIAHVEEFCPTARQIAARPELTEELERPMFLLIAAERRST